MRVRIIQDTPPLDRERYSSQHANILRGISIDHHHIRIEPWSKAPRPVAPAELTRGCRGQTRQYGAEV